MLNTLRRLLLKRPGPRIRLAMRWLFGLGILAALFVYVDVDQVVSLLRGVTWALALPAMFGLTAIHILGFVTWRVLSVRLLGMELPRGYLFRVHYAAQAVGSLTPSNIGADAYRVYAVRSDTCGWDKAVLPIAVQRVSSYLGLLLLGIVATILVPSPVLARTALAALVGCFVVAIVCLWAIGRSAAGNAMLGRLARKLHLPTDWNSMPVREWCVTIGIALVLALIFHAGSVTLSYVLVLATGGDGAMMPTLAVLMLARLAILLPIPIGGLGFQEGALALLFPVLGMPAETGLAVSILNRLAFLQTAVLGSVFILTGGTRRSDRSVEHVRGRSETVKKQTGTDGLHVGEMEGSL